MRGTSHSSLRFNPHAVKAAIHERHRNEEEDRAEHGRERIALLVVQRHRQFYGQQPEQRGELDDRIQRHRAGVFERIAHCVAHHRGGMQFGALHVQLGLDNFLGVVHGAPGVGHEDGLEQAEYGDRDQVADEVERLEEREGQRGEEHGDKDVEHALLRVLRADGHHLLGVGYGGLLGALQLDMLLDEFHRAICAGGDRLQKGSKNAKASVAKNTAIKMLSMPFCAYCVQMATTFLESDTEAFSALSSLICSLMNFTARYAPVVTACMDAPVNQ